MGDKYKIELGRNQRDLYYLSSLKALQENLSGSRLIKLLSGELSEIFPQEISVSYHDSGYFNNEVNESIEGLIRLYNSNKEKYEKNLEKVMMLMTERDNALMATSNEELEEILSRMEKILKD